MLRRGRGRHGRMRGRRKLKSALGRVLMLMMMCGKWRLPGSRTAGLRLSGRRQR